MPCQRELAHDGDSQISEADCLISLDNFRVVVYSDVATQRMIFIDNRKYVEGQSIDGNVVVESIVPDGAILLYQGKRIKLRASAD